ETDFLRVRAFPFAETIGRWIEAHDRVYVVEQNRDAQMRSMLAMHLPTLAARLRSVLHYTGLPLDAASVAEPIQAMEAGSAGVEPVPGEAGAGEAGAGEAGVKTRTKGRV
ncbi:MAG: hypothetical protein ACC662_06130, partial [Planctomycetota bacterium]